MRKAILTVLGAALIAASTQIAAGAERRHIPKVARAPVNEPFRNANNSVAAPAPSGWPYGGFSAPAGH
jgi:hypothetical protein